MTESKKKLAVSRHGRKTDACNSSGVSDLPNFIGPTLTITISEGQRISMTSHKALEACVSSPVPGIRRQDPQSHRMEAGFWGWRCSNTAARSSASVGSIRACPLAPMKWACAETHRLQAAGTTTNSDTSSRRCSPPREAPHPMGNLDLCGPIPLPHTESGPCGLRHPPRRSLQRTTKPGTWPGFVLMLGYRMARKSIPAHRCCAPFLPPVRRSGPGPVKVALHSGQAPTASFHHWTMYSGMAGSAMYPAMVLQWYKRSGPLNFTSSL